MGIKSSWHFWLPLGSSGHPWESVGSAWHLQESLGISLPHRFILGYVFGKVRLTVLGRNLLYFSEDKALKHVVRNEGFGQRVRLGQPMLGIG